MGERNCPWDMCWFQIGAQRRKECHDYHYVHGTIFEYGIKTTEYGYPPPFCTFCESRMHQYEKTQQYISCFTLGCPGGKKRFLWLQETTNEIIQLRKQGVL